MAAPTRDRAPSVLAMPGAVVDSPAPMPMTSRPPSASGRQCSASAMAAPRVVPTAASAWYRSLMAVRARSPAAFRRSGRRPAPPTPTAPVATPARSPREAGSALRWPPASMTSTAVQAHAWSSTDMVNPAGCGNAWTTDAGCCGRQYRACERGACSPSIDLRGCARSFLLRGACPPPIDLGGGAPARLVGRRCACRSRLRSWQPRYAGSELTELDRAGERIHTPVTWRASQSHEPAFKSPSKRWIAREAQW
jgi:hypothetical protein